MKNTFRRLTVSFLVLVLLAGFGSAFAVRSDDNDAKSHWAEKTMIRALNDALLEDTGSSPNPDDPMTGGGILAILCKVLSAEKTADLSHITDIGKDDQRNSIAARAVALGIISPVNDRLNLDKPVTRGRAFALLAEAFQLAGAEPDTSVLSSFSDGNTLSGAYRPAAAAMVSRGLIAGIKGALHMNNSISHAEFLTVLYRILPAYKNAAADPMSAADPTSAAGGAVFSGDVHMADRQFSDSIYFDCSASGVHLKNVTAPAVVLRSDSLRALSVSYSKIDRLVFASAGGDVFFSPGFMTEIKTAVVGTGGGKITLGAVPNVEVTGTGRDVFITGPVKSLVVSGSGNTITIAAGVTVDSVKIAAPAAGSTVVVNGLVGACRLFGPDTTIGGTGTVRQLLDNAKNSSITANTVNTAVNKSYGLNDVVLTLTAPDSFSAYETLKASVSIQAPEGSRRCLGAWYIDDVLISQSQVDTAQTVTVTLDSGFKNSTDAPVNATLSFILSYSDDGGGYHEIIADKAVTLDIPAKLDAAEALALVKSGYNGDYTLAWAQSNDYHDAVKTAWVNAKGYSSKTKYLVWVNITHQRVNVFTGSAGSWSLEKTFIVGTGAPGHDTPTGVFKILGRSTRGWTTKAYTVKPVIFFLNSAYGFHSRLYDPGTTNINDARIGFPVSHGCIRMYDEDVKWFYDNIPTNTTVVVH